MGISFGNFEVFKEFFYELSFDKTVSLIAYALFGKV